MIKWEEIEQGRSLYMNIGIRLHDTAPGNLEERLRFAKAQGFSCAHLALSKAVEGFAMEEAPRLLSREGFASEVRDTFGKTGMECAVLGCYLNLANPAEEAREKTRSIYEAHLKFAPLCGAGVVGTETPANPASPFAKNPGESEEAYRLLIDSLRPVVRCAEENGAVLAVEPVWCHIINTPERAERMLEEIHSDALRIILDAVNLIGPAQTEQADEIIEDAIRRLGEKVSVLHMKDFRLENGKVEAMACGTGVMRYERLLGFAKKYDLPMTLENTVPGNAEAARLHLERVGAQI